VKRGKGEEKRKRNKWGVLFSIRRWGKWVHTQQEKKEGKKPITSRREENRKRSLFFEGEGGVSLHLEGKERGGIKFHK